jgi:thiosulfate/3-mercaptopyruvate sulfurtransferase
MTNTTISPILYTAELWALVKNENLVIVDVSNGPMARANFDKNHLKGALFVDLNTQLADIQEDVSIGGRHPLPTFKQFSKTLQTLGIDKNSHVVLYDDKNGGNAAARFWWMLTAIGHEKVQVLNGGFQAAEKADFPISSEVTTPKLVDFYLVEKWNLPLVNLEKVAEVAKNDDFTVIDVRETARYNGEVEPIDLIAGHIPGAINVPFASNLDENGLFKTPSELKEKYELVFAKKASENVIVHCGSGVTACHTLLAMAYAGLEIPSLYVGSWSEWSRSGKEIGKVNIEK